MKELEKLMLSFTKPDSPVSMIQALSLRITHLLAEGVRNRSVTPAALDSELILKGKSVWVSVNNIELETKFT